MLQRSELHPIPDGPNRSRHSRERGPRTRGGGNPVETAVSPAFSRGEFIFFARPKKTEPKERAPGRPSSFDGDLRCSPETGRCATRRSELRSTMFRLSRHGLAQCSLCRHGNHGGNTPRFPASHPHPPALLALPQRGLNIRKQKRHASAASRGETRKQYFVGVVARAIRRPGLALLFSFFTPVFHSVIP